MEDDADYDPMMVDANQTGDEAWDDEDVEKDIELPPKLVVQVCALESLSPLSSSFRYLTKLYFSDV